MTLFQRALRRKNTADEVGDVCVSVILLDEETRRHTKGNITRSFTVQGTTVSAVAAVLETVLGKSGGA